MTNESSAAERRLNAVLGKCLPNFQPPEDLTVDEWADKYRILSAEASAEAGRWRTSRTPYLREIMACFTDPRVNRISMVSASQIGKSEAILNKTAVTYEKGISFNSMGHINLARTIEFGNHRYTLNLGSGYILVK